MARRCLPSKSSSCGMKGGLYNPFFQNGAYWYGSGGGSSPTGRFTALYYTGLGMSQEFMGYYYIVDTPYQADTSLYNYFNYM